MENSRISPNNKSKMKNSGIYAIVNNINGKFYIGSAKNLYSRKYVHFSKLKSGKHHNEYLQNSFNKYGEKFFDFIILTKCDLQNLLLFEQKYLSTYFDNQKKCYNINSNASSWLGRTHKQTTKKKISIAHKGKKLDEFTRQKMSKAHKGNKHSEETKRKIGQKTKARQKILKNCPQWGKTGEHSAYKKQTIVTTPSGTMHKFATVKDAAAFLLVNPSTISRIVRLKNGMINNHTVEIINNDCKKSGPKNNKGANNRNSKRIVVVADEVAAYSKEYVFETINEAAKFIGSPPSSISRALHGKQSIRSFKLYFADQQ